MARSCGIRIGPRHFELFVLDGSPMEVSSSVTQVFVNGREVE